MRRQIQFDNPVRLEDPIRAGRLSMDDTRNDTDNLGVELGRLAFQQARSKFTR